MTYSVRFRAYTPDGSYIGEVNDPINFEYRVPAGDTPTLSIDLSEELTHHARLAPPCQVAAEVRLVANGSTMWYEPPNHRFVMTKSERDRKDPTRKRTVQGVGMDYVLDGSIVVEDTAFAAATPTHIIGSLIAAARSRGGLKGMFSYLTDARDSRGTAWTRTINRSYDAGTTLRDVLLDLYESGEINYAFQGSELKIYRADYVVDRTTGSAPVYLSNDIRSAAPETKDWSKSANVLYLRGDKGFTASLTSADTGYGRRESTLSQSGVSDANSAQELLTSEVNRRRLEAVSITAEWSYDNDEVTPKLPGRDFNVGDRIIIADSDNTKQYLNVADFGVSIDGSGSGANYKFFVTCGHRIKGVTKQHHDDLRAIKGGSRVMPVGAGFGPLLGADDIGTDLDDRVLSKITPGDGNMPIDQYPTAGSTNPVSSGGVAQALQDQTGGAGITWDESPTAGSANAVRSRGIHAALEEREPALAWDSAPTAGSSNPVRSSGIHSALAGKQPNLKYDQVPTLGSGNVMTSDAIRKAIDGVKDSIPPPTAEEFVGHRNRYPVLYIGDVYFYREYTGMFGGAATSRIILHKATNASVQENPQFVLSPGLAEYTDRNDEVFYKEALADYIGTQEGTLYVGAYTKPDGSIEGISASRTYNVSVTGHAYQTVGTVEGNVERSASSLTVRWDMSNLARVLLQDDRTWATRQAWVFVVNKTGL